MTNLGKTRDALPLWAVRSRRIMLFLGAVLAATVLLLRVAGAQTGAPRDDRTTRFTSPTASSPRVMLADERSAETSSQRSFTRIDALLASLTIFVLAVFVGFEVIAKVPPTLHTPLMSGSNAVSGITIVGSLLVTGHGHWFISLVGMIAIVLAMINVVGGFLVTHRMLGMFRRK